MTKRKFFAIAAVILPFGLIIYALGELYVYLKYRKSRSETTPCETDQ